GSYPSFGKVHARRTVGCASYGKDTVLAIKKIAGNNVDITVLADIFKKKTSYYDSAIKIKRLWETNSFLTFPKLAKEILVNHRETKKILFEFEVLMFGHFFYLVPLPVFILFLRLLGKDVTFVCHQVITDIRDFEGHINIKKKGFKPKFINLLIPLF